MVVVVVVVVSHGRRSLEPAGDSCYKSPRGLSPPIKLVYKIDCKYFRGIYFPKGVSRAWTGAEFPGYRCVVSLEEFLTWSFDPAGESGYHKDHFYCEMVGRQDRVIRSVFPPGLFLTPKHI